MRKTIDGAIILNFKERNNLDKCPNCKSTEFIINKIPIKSPEVREMLKVRIIVQCKNCGYWTDWFDGYTWYPPKTSSGIGHESGH